MAELVREDIDAAVLRLDRVVADPLAALPQPDACCRVVTAPQVRIGDDTVRDGTQHPEPSGVHRPGPWFGYDREVSGHLRIDADLAGLADVRRFVRERAAAAHAPVECLDDLVQAVDEASTNVIVHGYHGRPGWVDISVELDEDRFVVVIKDAAPPFDPTKVPEPDLSIAPMARKPGGMGIHLMRASTDALGYRPRAGGGNILTMSRALRREQKEEV